MNRNPIDWSLYAPVVYKGRLGVSPCCLVCGKQIEAGQLVRWGPRRRKVLHDACAADLPPVEGK